ncbi:glycosyl hydrolase family 18 protein [Clostridium paraputrificum]|uniref:glycosyl hydrolase family 18 protein n=1 Tax=Clostridium paraputrificum TaxID=29363 RepID=UPI003D334781
MKKILRAILPMLLCTSLIVPSGISSKVNAVTNDTTKRIVSYFPNWAYYDEIMGNCKVENIAWDKVTHINHGFWEISKDYKIQTTDAWADFQDTEKMTHGDKADWEKYPSTGIGGNLLAGHFGEYRYYKKLYPNVKILISVGGWTRSEMFHEVAKDTKKVDTLAQSMVDTLKKYPFIDGIDIDWEYPGITRAPETFEGSTDRGAIGGPEDKENFTRLLKMVREKFDASNMKDKMLTVAVSAGEEKINLTEPDKYQQYVDYIGVMTYDFAGTWDNVTGNLAGLYGNPADTTRPKFNMDDAMKIYRDKYKVPANKLLAGTPLYSRGWGGVEPGPNGDGLYQKATGGFKGEPQYGGSTEGGGQYEWWGIKNYLEKAGSGWTKYRDPIARTPYLYNASKKQFITYEDETSLKERCNYINNNNYGGLIVWDASGDDFKNGAPMHTIMNNGLIKGQKFPEEEFEKEDVNRDRVIDIRDIALIGDKYNTLKGETNYVAACDVNSDSIVDIYDIVAVSRKLVPEVPKPDPEPKPDPNDTFELGKIYVGGDTVIYKGVKYRAKWWTQNVTPDTIDSAWEKVA